MNSIAKADKRMKLNIAEDWLEVDFSEIGDAKIKSAVFRLEEKSDFNCTINIKNDGVFYSYLKCCYREGGDLRIEVKTPSEVLIYDDKWPQAYTSQAKPIIKKDVLYSASHSQMIEDFKWHYSFLKYYSFENEIKDGVSIITQGNKIQKASLDLFSVAFGGLQGNQYENFIKKEFNHENHHFFLDRDLYYFLGEHDYEKFSLAVRKVDNEYNLKEIEREKIYKSLVFIGLDEDMYELEVNGLKKAIDNYDKFHALKDLDGLDKVSFQVGECERITERIKLFNIFRNNLANIKFEGKEAYINAGGESVTMFETKTENATFDFYVNFHVFADIINSLNEYTIVEIKKVKCVEDEEDYFVVSNDENDKIWIMIA
jgi:hypothetical protein